jgi:hypothetical protein
VGARKRLQRLKSHAIRAFEMFQDFSDNDHLGNLRAIEEYRETKSEIEEKVDSAVDRITDELADRAGRYGGTLPTTSGGLSKVVAALARATLTIEAISGVICEYVAEQIRSIRIQAVCAVLSIVKDTKPHLNIDIIELVFGITKCKDVDIARKHGEDRATVNKRKKAIQRKFGIETEEEKAVADTYRNVRLEQYQAVRIKLEQIRTPIYERSTVSVAA